MKQYYKQYRRSPLRNERGELRYGLFIGIALIVLFLALVSMALWLLVIAPAMGIDTSDGRLPIAPQTSLSAPPTSQSSAPSPQSSAPAAQSAASAAQSADSQPESAPASEAALTSAAAPAGEPAPAVSAPPAAASSSQSAPLSEMEKLLADTAALALPVQPRVRSEYFLDAAFIGDSITTGIALYDIVDADVFAANGITVYTIGTKPVVDTTAGNKITILESLAIGQHNKIYLMLGANGLPYLTTERTIEGFSALLDELKSKYPQSVIYLQSILPVNEPLYTQNYKAVIENSEIRTINYELAKLAGQKGVTFLDLYSLFADADGAMPAENTPDGVHITSECYARWLDYLKDHALQPQ